MGEGGEEGSYFREGSQRKPEDVICGQGPEALRK